MRLPLYGIIAISSLLNGCGNESSTLPPFEVVTDVHHSMELIVYPAADLLWESAGFVIDAEGEHDLSPTTDEGWHEVEINAAVLAESGNLLMLPGRSAGPQWDAWSAALIQTSRKAMLAAEAQDASALFDAGGEIYQVCKGCHEQYWVKTEDSDEPDR